MLTTVKTRCFCKFIRQRRLGELNKRELAYLKQAVEEISRSSQLTRDTTHDASLSPSATRRHDSLLDRPRATDTCAPDTRDLRSHEVNHRCEQDRRSPKRHRTSELVTDPSASQELAASTLAGASSEVHYRDGTNLHSEKLAIESSSQSPSLAVRAIDADTSDMARRILESANAPLKTLMDCRSLWLQNPVEFFQVPTVSSWLVKPNTTMQDKLLGMFNAAGMAKPQTAMMRFVIAWMFTREFPGKHHPLGPHNRTVTATMRRYGSIAIKLADSLSPSLLLLTPPQYWTKKSHAQIGSIVEVLRNNGEFYSILKSFESLTDKLQEYMHNTLREIHSERHIVTRSSERAQGRDTRVVTDCSSAKGSRPLLSLDRHLVPDSEHRENTFESIRSRLLMFLLYLHNENIFLPFLKQKYVSRIIWSEAGELEVMEALQDGCDSEVLDVLSDQDQLDEALGALCNEGKIVWSLTDRNNVRIEADVQRRELARLTEEQSSYWKGQALLFVSRLVQSGEYLPKRIKTAGYVRQHVISHLHHMVAEYSDEDWLTIGVSEAVRTLIAGSHFDVEQRKVLCLERARNLCHRTGVPDLSVVMRRIAILRQSGLVAEAQKLLESLQLDMNTMTSCAREYGMLILSKAEIYAHLDRLEDAVQLLDTHPQASSASSTHDKLVTCRVQLSKGRFLRYQGRFQTALVVLEQVMLQVQSQPQMEGLIDEAFNGLVDLLVDTDPAKAQVLIEQKSDHKNSRVRVSYADSLLNQKKVLEARLVFQEIARNPHALGAMAQLRVLTGLARSYHYDWLVNRAGDAADQALHHWTKAIAHLREHFPQEADGRTTAIVLLALANLRHKVGDKQGALASMRQIHFFTRQSGCTPTFDELRTSQCWLPGLGKTFLEEILGDFPSDELQSLLDEAYANDRI